MLEGSRVRRQFFCPSIISRLMNGSLVEGTSEEKSLIVLRKGEEIDAFSFAHKAGFPKSISSRIPHCSKDDQDRQSNWIRDP